VRKPFERPADAIDPIPEEDWLMRRKQQSQNTRLTGATH
jgi:hypothetical protein